MNVLEKRCIEISYRHRLSHLSSVLNAVNVIAQIYKERKEHEPFVLGNSHAALGLWVVLETFGLCDAEEMCLRHGTHAARDVEHGVWVSGGSLGQPETVAVGLALADRRRRVFVLTSDGACAEGSIWESLRLAGRLGLSNLKVTVICNGFGAYHSIDVADLTQKLRAVFPISICYGSQGGYPMWLRGIPAHYLVLNEQQYSELLCG